MLLPFGAGAAGGGTAAVCMPFVPPEPSKWPAPSPSTKIHSRSGVLSCQRLQRRQLCRRSGKVSSGVKLRRLRVRSSPSARMRSAGTPPAQSLAGPAQSERRNAAVNRSGSASQGTNPSLWPFLTFKSPMGPGGCGKREASRQLTVVSLSFHTTQLMYV